MTIILSDVCSPIDRKKIGSDGITKGFQQEKKEIHLNSKHRTGNPKPIFGKIGGHVQHYEL
jgi:hypothetical protein